MSHDAFISYSTHDKASADATCAALEASGVRCWIAPRDITPGAEWGEAIIDGINHCRVFILIFSASANESPQIRREVERAVSKGIPVIPLRIQDIAPTRSLEYFIGTVHWLDALTPPLEFHLRRLVETVKALLQIDATPPRILPSSTPSASPPSGSWIGLNRRMVARTVLTCVALTAAAIAVRWFVALNTPQPQAASSTSAPVQPPAQLAKATVDPIFIGTFEHETVIDDYNWRVVYSIAADGTYRVVTSQEEEGTYHAAAGVYRTTGAKTGRVRTGMYRAVGRAAIEVTSATGVAIFRPSHPTPPVDQAHPIMLGTWIATIVQGGITWTLTIQNNPDGTYYYQGRAEDHGSCVIADHQLRTTSALTGQSRTITYRVVDARTIEVTGPEGVATWERH